MTGNLILCTAVIFCAAGAIWLAVTLRCPPQQSDDLER